MSQLLEVILKTLAGAKSKTTGSVAASAAAGTLATTQDPLVSALVGLLTAILTRLVAVLRSKITMLAILLLPVFLLASCATVSNEASEIFYQAELVTNVDGTTSLLSVPTSEVRWTQTAKARNGGQIEDMIQDQSYTFSENGSTTFSQGQSVASMTSPDTVATIASVVDAAVQAAIAAVVAQPSLKNPDLALGRQETLLQQLMSNEALMQALADRISTPPTIPVPPPTLSPNP